MSDWPSTLPQLPLQDGFSERFADNVIETSMDTGPAKRRLRGTVAPRPITVQFQINKTQRAALENFFTATTFYGLLSFRFPLPPDSTMTYVHFKQGSPPSFVPSGPYVIATINLEVDP